MIVEYAVMQMKMVMYSLTDIPEGNGYAITASKIGYESQTFRRNSCSKWREYKWS